MKKLINLLTAVLISFATMAGGPAEETYTVNLRTSTLEWTGKKVTGSHNGKISIQEGRINVADGAIIGGTIIIDMQSIVVSDIEDEGTNAKLKGHLSSDDFFGVGSHPTATFKIISVKKKEGENYTIKADLTIKGKTETIEFPALVKMEENKLVAIGTAEIDRTKYDIKYGSGSFFDNLGDKAIDDTFSVKFKIGAMK